MCIWQWYVRALLKLQVALAQSEEADGLTTKYQKSIWLRKMLQI